MRTHLLVVLNLQYQIWQFAICITHSTTAVDTHFCVQHVVVCKWYFKFKKQLWTQPLLFLNVVVCRCYWQFKNCSGCAGVFVFFAILSVVVCKWYCKFKKLLCNFICSLQMTLPIHTLMWTHCVIVCEYAIPDVVVCKLHCKLQNSCGCT